MDEASRRTVRDLVRPFGAAGRFWGRVQLLISLLPVAAIIAAIFTGAAGLVAVLLLITGLAVWALYRANKEAIAREVTPQPHLVFVGTDNAQASFITTRLAPAATVSSTATSYSEPTTSEIVTTASSPSDFVRVQVANDPPTPEMGLRAERVVGRIAFLDSEDRLLIPEIVGRWAETPQRAETRRLGISLEETQLDIDANGLPHPLDIAMKRNEDDHFYAYNHENSTADRGMLDKHRINARECRVRVRLRPTNGPETTGMFRLWINEKGRLRLEGPTP